LLQAACPSWERSEEWQPDSGAFYDDDGEPLLFNVMSSLVRHVIRLLSQGETHEVAATFAAAERMIREGDSAVRGIAVVGILEDASNGNMHSRTKPDDLVPFLGEWSKWWWDEVEMSWSGRVKPVGASGRPRPAGMPDPMSDPMMT
jgi:hypothetical protein